MFSAVQFDIVDSVVLDLFAGSGQLGIEALSRGAKFAYFCDINPEALSVVKSNLSYTKLSESAFVKKLPWYTFLKLLKAEIDLAFIDPPFEQGLIESALVAIVPKMTSRGIIVCEHEEKLQPPNEVDTYKLTKTYNCGSSTISIYRNTK